MFTHHPVAVLGAGPVGLAAAAHLAERNVPFIVFEAGPSVGASMQSWGHVRLFSPWRTNMDRAAQRLLKAHGWSSPDPAAYPTGADIVEQYLTPLAQLDTIAQHVRLNHQVIGVTRQGVDKLRDDDRSDRPFIVTTDGPAGVTRTPVRAVIDATGTWLAPNPVGAEGIPAIGEERVAQADQLRNPRCARRRTRPLRRQAGGSRRKWTFGQARRFESCHCWPSRPPTPRSHGSCAGARTSGCTEMRSTPACPSVASSALTRTNWFLRAGSGSKRASASNESMPTSRASSLVSPESRETGPFDEIIAATGFRPDFSFLREVRLDLDPWVESTKTLAPLIDPNVHSCGSVPPHGAAELAHPEQGFYAIGAKSYGRAPNLLLATGYEQARSVVAELAGDHEAAARVELVLPTAGSSCGHKAQPEPEAPEPELATSACCG